MPVNIFLRLFKALIAFFLFLIIIFIASYHLSFNYFALKQTHLMFDSIFLTFLRQAYYDLNFVS